MLMVCRGRGKAVCVGGVGAGESAIAIAVVCQLSGDTLADWLRRRPAKPMESPAWARTPQVSYFDCIWHVSARTIVFMVRVGVCVCVCVCVCCVCVVVCVFVCLCVVFVLLCVVCVWLRVFACGRVWLELGTRNVASVFRHLQVRVAGLEPTPLLAPEANT